jgi:hypothetical protein
MPKQDDLWNFIREYRDETSIVPDGSVQKKTGDQPEHLEIHPITEAENNGLRLVAEAKNWWRKFVAA